jgi:hypothetical protein
MPNWCYNRITIKGDKKTISEMYGVLTNKAKDAVGLLQTYIPCPEELLNTTSPNTVNPNEMVAKYGSPDWYEWSLANWGIKWDFSEVEATIDPDGSLYFTCETPWGPPTEALPYLRVQYDLSIRCEYCEPNIGFAGVLDDNDVQYDTDLWPEFIYDDPKDVEEAELAEEN